MAYKGKFTLKAPDKYIGNPDTITFRSLWERACFTWCEKNSDIIKWSSEEIVVPYICETDGRRHSYYTDLFIEFSNGKRVLVEIKPDKQTRPPEKPKSGRKTRRYITESLAYVKNKSKWIAAKQFAERNNMEFQVWTEHTLKELGIRIVTKK